MKEYFLKLYRYNAWANKKVLSALEKQQVNDEKVLTLMSHILVAQYLWLHRIQGLPAPPYKLWDQYPLSQLINMGEEINKRWLEFVETTENFNRELSYNNFTGNPYVNNVEHIMMHLVNHCTYHRGQIAMLLRQKGYEPVNTDFITYDRVITNQLQD